jgi:scaffold protein (connect acetoacetyl-CoA thiolase and HMG-CoA synthase)
VAAPAPKSTGETPKPRVGEWEEADGRVYLIASRCVSCGEIFFPARRVCLRCARDAMERVRLSGPARLANYTVIHQVPAGFPSPLVAGYGEFEPGVSVFAPIDGEAEALKPGMPLELRVGPIRSYENGESLVAYRFRPIVNG